MKSVVIYTDGSTAPNPGEGGWAAILIYKRDDGQIFEKVVTGYEPKTTNSRMELTAAIMALSSLKNRCEVELHTDSQYVQMGITEWIAKWHQNGWRSSTKGGIKNVDLWQALWAEQQRHVVHWHWVRGHNGNHYNERADELAAAARLRKGK